MAGLRNSARFLFGFIYFVFVNEISARSGQVCRDELDTRGRHFLVTVPPFHSDSYTPECIIYIASEGTGKALITKHLDQLTQTIGNYSLSKGVVNVNIDCTSIIQSSVGRQTKVVEVETTTDVAVYVAGYISNSAAAFVAFPSKTLSNSYVIPTYKTVYSTWYNYILITSLKDDTNITVTNFNGNHIEILDKMESYTLKTLQDPNVTSVTSNKDVNVLYGSMCTRIPVGYSCDGLYDSPIPVRYFGTSFIVPPIIPKSGYAVRLYGNTNGTTVNVKYSNGTSNGNVSLRGMHELLFGADATTITSDQPINVVQYGFTAILSDSADYGDAFMASVPALTHFSNNYVFPTPFSDKNFTYRITITIQKDHIDGLLLNDKNMATMKKQGTWTPQSPFNNFTIVTLEIPPGNHTLHHQSPDVRFSVLLYGLKYFYGFGFYLGFSFPVKDSVAEYTCENGGSCLGEGKCICFSGFTGDRCQYNIDDCITNPCMNGATCVGGISSYTCSCHPGYTGLNCETNIDDCYANPCKNGATCIDGVSRYTCVCNHGYTGNTCETDIDECSANPCINGATCVDGLSSYTCVCIPGYTGFSCETNIDECSDNPCMNGATCVDGISSYKCVCIPGYTGSSCETNIDDCQTKPCMNGGTCIDGYTRYTCLCNHGYTGDNCQTDIDECSNNPCMNGATCVDGIAAYRCSCQLGYTGQNCETLLQTNGLMCFSCDYTSAPSYCDNIEYCSGSKMCFLERLTHSQGYQYYKSGCKERQICSQESQADAQTSKSCLKCCEGNFCNSQGCGDQGLPPVGSRGPLCLDCSFVSDPKLCHKVAFCALDEKCHIEKVQWGANYIYHLGCKSSHECAFEASTRMVSANTMTSRSVPACTTCCGTDFCNRNCTRHDTDNQQVIIG